MATSGSDPPVDDLRRLTLSSSPRGRDSHDEGCVHNLAMGDACPSYASGGGGEAEYAGGRRRSGECGVASPSSGAPGCSAGPSRTPTTKRAGRKVRYTAFLLDDVSRCALLNWMCELGAESPSEWTTFCDHVTVHHAPTAAQLASFPFGIPCEMAVLGAAGDERARAVHVDVPDFVPQPASAVRLRRKREHRARRKGATRCISPRE